MAERERYLGKIASVKMGLGPASEENPTLVMYIGFKFNGIEQASTRVSDMKIVRDTLLDAQVDDIYALHGKPVEVEFEIDGSAIAKWRILTEVI